MTNLKLLSFHSQLASNSIKTPHAAQPMSFGKSIKKAKPVSLTPPLADIHEAIQIRVTVMRVCPCACYRNYPQGK